MCTHKVGDTGELCLVCGAPTVYFNKKYSFCKNIGCPLFYKPQQWFERTIDDNGDMHVRVKTKEESNGTN